MADPRHAQSVPSSPADDEGVRVLRKPDAAGLPVHTRALLGAGFVVVVAMGWSLWGPANAARSEDAIATAAASTAAAMPASGPTAAPATTTRVGAIEFNALRDLPTPQGDPDDLASYFREGDAVPDTATLIKAMNEAGVRTGIAAFNPPGTSPPLEGLAVPADFALPPGYVRHQQATDEGEIIEAILMFSPDLVLRDAQGRVLPLPENRVVPPEMAPPGLPIRWVRPGKG